MIALAAAGLAVGSWGWDYPFEGLTAGQIVGQDGWEVLQGDGTSYVVVNNVFSPMNGSRQSLFMGNEDFRSRIIRRLGVELSSGRYLLGYDLRFKPWAGGNVFHRVGLYTTDYFDQLMQPAVGYDGSGFVQSAFLDPDGLGGADYTAYDLGFSGNPYDPNKWYRFECEVNLTAHTVKNFVIYDISTGMKLEVVSNRVDTFYLKNDGSTWVSPFGALMLGYNDSLASEGWYIDNFSFAPPSEEVFATTMRVTRGVLTGGTVNDLRVSDDRRVDIQQRPQFSPALANAEAELDGNATQDGASSITVTAELSCTGIPSSNLRQRVELWNFQAGRWDIVDERAPTTGDSVVTVNVSSGASNYVQAGTRLLKARIGWFDRGTIAPAWLGRIDRFGWSISR